MSKKEVQRLLSLPRPRVIPVDELTDLLRIEGTDPPPKMPRRLKPSQADALWQATVKAGLFAPLAVGAGKTLVALLLPTLIDCERPLILTRSALVPQMKRMAKEYSKYWHIRDDIEFFAYHWLSEDKNYNYLSDNQFDLIVADEAHKIANTHGSDASARASRVYDYVVNEQQGDCLFAAMSGTMADKSVIEYWSLAYMALGEDAPVPLEYYDQRALAAVLDITGKKIPTAQDFALWMDLATDDESLPLQKRLRNGYRHILRNTPGVAVSEDASCNASIDLIAVDGLETPKTVVDALSDLETLWSTPTGEYIEDIMHKVNWELRLACGYYYEIDWPGEPDYEWMEIRSEWLKFVHSLIGTRDLDSYARARDYVRDNLSHLPVWQDWVRVRDRWPKIGPPRKSVLMSDYIVQFVKEFTKGDDWLVFYRGRAMEEMLWSEGFEVYGAGTEPREDGYGVQCLSIDVHKEGRNLQAWKKMLIINPPPSNKVWEQVIGRIHRQGQEEDTVEVYYLSHLPIFRNNFKKALDRAERTEDTEGMAQKLCLAYQKSLTIKPK